MTDLEEQKVFNTDMAKRIAEMENQNDYLQKKLHENHKDCKGKDQDIDHLQLKLKSVQDENQRLKKQLDKYRDAYQSHEAINLINECRKKSRQRDIGTKEGNEIYMKHISDENYQLKIREKLFNVGRRAAEKLREASVEENEPVARRGLHHSVDGVQSVRAELEAIRTNFRNSGVASTRIAASLSIEEARRVIMENSIGKSTKNRSMRQRATFQSGQISEQTGQQTENMFMTNTMQPLLEMTSSD